MTDKTQPAALDVPVDNSQAATVVAYLQEHPDFFLREPALVVSLALPSEGPGGTVSLAQHQASLLRGQLQALEEKFAQLLQINPSLDAEALGLVE